MTTAVSFPNFVNNQLLLAADLNHIISTLDQQDRLTRVCLHGMGIMCGLEVNFEDEGGPVISIQEGFGLSSDGYMIDLQQVRAVDEVNLDLRWLEYRFCKPAPLYPKVFDFHESIEGRFSGEPAENGYYELLQEKPADDNSVLDLGSFFSGQETNPGQFAVVLLHYRLQETKNPCQTSCNETGRSFNYGTRVLLVRKDLVCRDFKPGGGEIKWPDKPRMRRFGYGDGQIMLCDTIIDKAGFFERYEANMSEAVAGIQAAYDAAFQNAKPLLGESADPFTTYFENLKSLIAAFDGAVETDAWNYLIQHVYGHLKDLILAYEEFADAAFALVEEKAAWPDLKLFPGYLVLGGLTDNFGIDDECRTNCLPPCNTCGDKSRPSLVRFLFDRMKKLTQLFFLGWDGATVMDHTAESNDYPAGAIRVSASRGRNLPLGQRAIPYYYRPAAPVGTVDVKIRECWDYEAWRKEKSHLIPSYHPDAGDANALLYDIDAYGFIRIEGHPGMEVGVAYDEVARLRQEYNLPFNIRCLLVGDGSGLDNLRGADRPDYTELQSAYEKAKAYMASKLEDPAQVGSLAAYVREFDFNAVAWSGFSILECEDTIKALLQKIHIRKVELETQHREHYFFHRFACHHPGLEHMGGVPAGGTFILVYTIVDDQGYQTPFVIGDFCLPYVCCEEIDARCHIDVPCPLPPVDVELEPLVFVCKKVFCNDDEKQYPILTYPPGADAVLEAYYVFPNGSRIKRNELIDTSEETPCFRLLDENSGLLIPENIFQTAQSNKIGVSLEYTPEAGGDKAAQLVEVWKKPAGNIVDTYISSSYDDETELENGRTYSLAFASSHGFNVGLNFRWEYYKKDENGNIFPVIEGDQETFRITFEIPSRYGYLVRLYVSNPVCERAEFTLNVPDDLTPPSFGAAKLASNVSGGQGAAAKEAESSLEKAAGEQKEERSKAKAVIPPAEEVDKKRTAGKPAKAPAALLNQRLERQRQALDALKADEVLAGYKTYANAVLLLKYLRDDPKGLNDRFLKVARQTITTIKRPGGADDKNLTTMLANALAFYLDRQLSLSPDEVLEGARKIVEEVMTKAADAKISKKALRDAWNSGELKEAFPDSGALKEYIKMLK